MNMPGEQDERRTRIPVTYAIAGISACILLVLIVVIANNRAPYSSETTRKPSLEREKGSSALGQPESPAPADFAHTNGTERASSVTNDLDGNSFGSISSGNANIDQLYKENRLTPDDLDFWGMYPKQEETVLKDADVIPESPVASQTPKPAPADPSTDGKHTFITRNDGTSDWVQINPYLTKNIYDTMKLILKEDRMGYYEGQKRVSFFGVDISRHSGTVDFAGLKEDGVDFVMIRLGARGYGSGQILLDENFEANIAAANKAGLHVGVYFFSQAITVEEAAEEADFVIQHLAGHSITYPVAFDMEYISNDVSRIDSLKKKEKTEIAAAFMSRIKASGFSPILYGTKEWLVEQIDLSKLLEYDVWLSQQTELPDYPYQYQMWQYSLNGSVAGIEGNVDFNISFVDYGAK